MQSIKFISVCNKMIMELHEVVIQYANRAQHMLIAGNTNSASTSSVHFYDWIVSVQSGAPSICVQIYILMPTEFCIKQESSSFCHFILHLDFTPCIIQYEIHIVIDL